MLAVLQNEVDKKYAYLAMYLERDMAQWLAWLERGALSMSLPVVRFLLRPTTYHVNFLPSQYWDIVSMLCPWLRHLTLKCFT